MTAVLNLNFKQTTPLMLLQIALSDIGQALTESVGQNQDVNFGGTEENGILQSAIYGLAFQIINLASTIQTELQSDLNFLLSKDSRSRTRSSSIVLVSLNEAISSLGTFAASLAYKQKPFDVEDIKRVEEYASRLTVLPRVADIKQLQGWTQP